MLLLFLIQLLSVKLPVWYIINSESASLTQADISVPILYLSSCERYRQPAEHLGCDNLARAMNS